jgi:hypothetical protein
MERRRQQALAEGTGQLEGRLQHLDAGEGQRVAVERRHLRGVGGEGVRVGGSEQHLSPSGSAA